jgi:hypothetical protein
MNLATGEKKARKLQHSPDESREAASRLEAVHTQSVRLWNDGSTTSDPQPSNSLPVEAESSDEHQKEQADDQPTPFTPAAADTTTAAASEAAQEDSGDRAHRINLPERFESDHEFGIAKLSDKDAINNLFAIALNESTPCDKVNAALARMEDIVHDADAAKVRPRHRYPRRLEAPSVCMHV